MSAEGDVARRKQLRKRWMKRWKAVLPLLGAGLLGVLIGFAAFAWLGQRTWVPGAQAQVLVLLAASGLFGGLAANMYLRMRGRNMQNSWLYVALFCVVIMAISAARTDELSFVQALLVIVFGSIALVAAVNALSLFRLGEAIEFENSWGGLGSGLGGWRLSSATSLILSALLFACGAIVTAQISREPPQTVAAETKAAKDTAGANATMGAKQLAAQPSPSPTALPSPGASVQPSPSPAVQPSPGPTATPSATPTAPKGPGSTP